MKTFILSTLLALMSLSGMAQNYPTPILKLNPANPLDTLPNDSVIISEIYLPNWSTWGFIEITNHSTRTVPMSHFFLQGRYPFSGGGFLGSQNKVNLRGDLHAGKCYIIAIGQVNTSLNVYGQPVWENFTNGPRFINRMADTIFNQYGSLYPQQYTLFNRYINHTKGGTVDSAIIDLFNAKAYDAPSKSPIAGVAAISARHWIRKTNVLRGLPIYNQTEGQAYWEKVRGTSDIDSEWLPVMPTYLTPYNALPFTTVKNFGNSTMASIKSAGKVVIDTVKMQINMPYNISRDKTPFRWTYN